MLRNGSYHLKTKKLVKNINEIKYCKNINLKKKCNSYCD